MLVTEWTNMTIYVRKFSPWGTCKHVTWENTGVFVSIRVDPSSKKCHGKWRLFWHTVTLQTSRIRRSKEFLIPHIESNLSEISSSLAKTHNTASEGKTRKEWRQHEKENTKILTHTHTHTHARADVLMFLRCSIIQFSNGLHSSILLRGFRWLYPSASSYWLTFVLLSIVRIADGDDDYCCCCPQHRGELRWLSICSSDRWHCSFSMHPIVMYDECETSALDWDLEWSRLERGSTRYGTASCHSSLGRFSSAEKPREEPDEIRLDWSKREFLPSVKRSREYSENHDLDITKEKIGFRWKSQWRSYVRYDSPHCRLGSSMDRSTNRFQILRRRCNALKIRRETIMSRRSSSKTRSLTGDEMSGDWMETQAEYGSKEQVGQGFASEKIHHQTVKSQLNDQIDHFEHCDRFGNT